MEQRFDRRQPRGENKLKITAVVPARIRSSRCARKMVRPFAGTTLFEIAIGKLSQLEVDACYAAVGEPELIRLAEAAGVPVWKRSARSLVSENLLEINDYVGVLPTDYFLVINAANPLLSVETINRALRFFRDELPKSLFGVITRRQLFWNANGARLFASSTTNTKQCDFFYEAAHSIYLFNPQAALALGVWWTYTAGDPHLFVLPPEEVADIDTENDFIAAEALYRHRINLLEASK